MLMRALSLSHQVTMAILLVTTLADRKASVSTMHTVHTAWLPLTTPLLQLLTHTLSLAQWKSKSAQPRMSGRFRKCRDVSGVSYPATCPMHNLYVATGIYRQPNMSLVSTLPSERLSHYADAPKPTREQFQECFNMQKSSTSVAIMKQDYLHVQHNQLAGFTTLGPTMALCFSKCADSGEQASPNGWRKLHA